MGMTPTKCHELLKKQDVKYNYFGVQVRTECWASQTLDTSQLSKARGSKAACKAAFNGVGSDFVNDIYKINN